MISKFQTALKLVFPPRCLTCGEMVESDDGLCSLCWAQTPFLGGPVCGFCGAHVLGEDQGQGPICEACHEHPRNWSAGRSALAYEGVARKLVLALKHGDRQDIAPPAAKWLAQAAKPIWPPDTPIIVPVPLHWTRLLKRRYNQSALLARALAKQTQSDYCPDALVRPKVRGSTEGLTTAERFIKLEGAIVPHPKRGRRLAGRHVLIVDDVMTSGATLQAAVAAALHADAKDVRIVTLARVAKDA